MSELLNHGERIAPNSLEVGQTVTLVWSPYDWARDEFGFSGRMTVEITKMPRFEIESGAMVDVEMKTQEGVNLRWNVDNGYVTTGEGGSPFDKGRFRRFETTE